MVGVTLKVGLKDTATAGLAELAAKAASLHPLMDQIGAALLTSTQMRFEHEQGPDGNPWPRSLRARIEGGKTLQDDGNLYRSLTFRATDAGVELGTNVIYAAIQQFGGTIKAKAASALRFLIGDRWISKDSVTIPARPYLGLDDQDHDEIEYLVGNYLQVAQ